MPIAPFRGAIAKTFWGKAWCDNLERYSDYANRLPRGRTYVRNGSVIDLNISAGSVHALVVGSSLYKVSVNVVAVPDKLWQAMRTDCSNSIDSLVELLQGKFSNAVMERICKPGSGLFPTPSNMQFSCTCPDWAKMCKHVAAVLYGVGARLDHEPELLFKLRRVEAKELVAEVAVGLIKTKRTPIASKLLDDSLLPDIFGIEMAEPIFAKRPSKPKPQPRTSPVKASKVSQTRKKKVTNKPRK